MGFEMTSSKWPSTMEAGGIFSHTSSQNPWASANKVYVGYCSSDGAAPGPSPEPELHSSLLSLLPMPPQPGWVLHQPAPQRTGSTSRGRIFWPAPSISWAQRASPLGISCCWRAAQPAAAAFS